MKNKVKDPTPRQIQRACEKIQKEWSDDQEVKRRVVGPEIIAVDDRRYKAWSNNPTPASFSES